MTRSSRSVQLLGELQALGMLEHCLGHELNMVQPLQVAAYRSFDDFTNAVAMLVYLLARISGTR